ncbi:MAG: hypothetical protein K9I85_10950 [Saprospiraceae bacterium]|nr:hypothetical protein [Saprospiraceae bacterium]
MRNLLILIKLSMLLLFIGCGNQGEEFSPDKPSDNFHINTVEYNDCEYVYVTNPDGTVSGLTHKGNCQNKEHSVSAVGPN